MRRYAVPAVIAAVAVIFVVVLAVGISNQGSNNSIGYSVASRQYRLAPDYQKRLSVLQGSGAKTRSLADYRGRVVLVNLFASWCTQCQLESRVLARAQELLAAHGGTVVGVSYDDTPSQALGFARQNHVTYPLLQDDAGHFANAFNVNGVPDSYVLNRAGKIVALNLYQLTDKWVNTTLRRIVTG